MNDAVLQARYAHRFDVQDTDGDGLMDVRDVIGRAERLLAGFREPVDSARGEAVLRGAKTYWAGVADLAGTDADGTLTKQNFIEALVRARETGVLPDVVRPSVAAHVALVDTDGDGYVSLDEFIRSQEATGMSQEQALRAFKALDLDGDGRVTLDEWQHAVVEFYTSPEKAGPGGLIMGMED